MNATWQSCDYDSNHECVGSLSPLSCFEHMISHSPLQARKKKCHHLLNALCLWDVVNFQILDWLKMVSPMAWHLTLRIHKFFEWLKHSKRPEIRSQQELFRPLKIGNWGLMSPLLGDLGLVKKVLLWLLCCLLFFSCVYLWFVLVSYFVFYSGISGVYIVSWMKQGVCMLQWLKLNETTVKVIWSL